jgi:hypothetical protein
MERRRTGTRTSMNQNQNFNIRVEWIAYLSDREAYALELAACNPCCKNLLALQQARCCKQKKL